MLAMPVEIPCFSEISDPQLWSGFCISKEEYIDVFVSALVVLDVFADIGSVILEMFLQAKLISEPAW